MRLRRIISSIDRAIDALGEYQHLKSYDSKGCDLVLLRSDVDPPPGAVFLGTPWAYQIIYDSHDLRGRERQVASYYYDDPFVIVDGAVYYNDPTAHLYAVPQIISEVDI